MAKSASGQANIVATVLGHFADGAEFRDRDVLAALPGATAPTVNAVLHRWADAGSPRELTRGTALVTTGRGPSRRWKLRLSTARRNELARATTTEQAAADDGPVYESSDAVRLPEVLATEPGVLVLRYEGRTWIARPLTGESL